MTVVTGAFVPQGWKLEYTRLGGGRRVGPHQGARAAHRAARLHHLWVYDHVETVPRREPTHVFEAFTTLAALAQHTTTIKLGQMVTCAAYRNAGLLAKEAACVDVFSGGRLILGIGAGWYEREYQAYGYPFPSAGDAACRSSTRRVEVVKRLWTEETVTYQGKHLAFDGAYCDPKPIQQLPEIWIGGGGEKVTLRIEARHADKTNWQTGIDGVRAQVGAARAVLRRDRPRLRHDRAHARSRLPGVRHRSRPAAWLDSPGGGSLWGRGDPDEYVRDNFVGTAEQVAREGAGVRRRGLPRVRAVVPRLPVVRQPRSGRARRRAATSGC